MPSISFESYLKSIQKNRQKGSERSHYPALKALLDDPANGIDAVTEVTYKLKEQRVYINKTRYFEGIAPDVWEFKIGGYQVLSKWLKHRKKAKRTLSFDELLHYQKVVVALKETMELMEGIDKLIPSFPIE